MNTNIFNDLQALDENKINIIEKKRSSRFVWRGQFSPELIEYLLDNLFKESQLIYDPFSGSGTVLFESSFKGKNTIGSEINPSAWFLSSSLALNTLNLDEIRELIETLNRIILVYNNPNDIIMLAKTTNDFKLRTALRTILLCATGNAKIIEPIKLLKATNSFINFLEGIKNYTGTVNSNLEDCRKTRLLNNSIEGVITSPPYINVFNYHQNYRPIMELLGFTPLEVANAEIGANRKFRQNRFLTVIQYTLDMGLSLDELARVMKKNALAVMVVGRESKVLGESFNNSKLITQLIEKHNCFELLITKARNFKNKFGQLIIEDLIFFRKIDEYFSLPLEESMDVGLEMLLSKLKESKSENSTLIKKAINYSSNIKPSPFLDFKNYE